MTDSVKYALHFSLRTTTSMVKINVLSKKTLISTCNFFEVHDDLDYIV